MNDIPACFQNVLSTDNRDLLILDVFLYEIQQQVETAFLRDLDEAKSQDGRVDASRPKRGKPSGRAAHLGNIDVGFWIESELRQRQLHSEIVGAAETTNADSLAFELRGSGDACAGYESIGQSIVDSADDPSLCAFEIGNDQGRTALAKKIQALADQVLHGQSAAGDEYDFYV